MTLRESIVARHSQHKVIHPYTPTKVGGICRLCGYERNTYMHVAFVAAHESYLAAHAGWVHSDMGTIPPALESFTL